MNDFEQANEQLWQDWLGSYTSFIFDGPTNPEEWFHSKYRILCLMKEAHGGGVWNHAKGIRECKGLMKVSGSANQATHYRVVEWLYSLESTLEGKKVSIEEERRSNYPNCRNTMLRSAWVNIKKADGISTSRYNNLVDVVKRDGQFLIRQINLMAPRIILCCGTFSIVKNLLFPNVQKMPDTERTYCCDQYLVVDYRHPGRAAKVSYIPLIEEANRIRNSNAFASYARLFQLPILNSTSG